MSVNKLLSLLEHTRPQFEAWLTQHGLPGYRAAQVWQWVFRRRTVEFDLMSDLPKPLREDLARQWQVLDTRIADAQTGSDGTEKLLLALHDDQQIECVLLRDDRQHHTVCVSTQVGCAMGCAFCASGLDGLVRNLTRGEILQQMLHLGRLLGEDQRISHVVVMGMGEPLANLDELLPALDLASAEEGLGISARRITISSVGLPKGIRRLAEHDHSYHLAISLHAADDRLRNRLIPANRNIGIAAIVAAADDYFAATGRRVTFEYVLLAEITDRAEHARDLVALLRGRPALVNVIPYNPVPELPYRTPSSATTARFVETLQQGGLNVKLRYRKGDRIDAACGQLRRRGG